VGNAASYVIDMRYDPVDGCDKKANDDNPHHGVAVILVHPVGLTVSAEIGISPEIAVTQDKIALYCIVPP
jgi:hypothetical protein